MRLSVSSPGWGAVPKALAVITLILMLAGQASADHVRGPRLQRVVSLSRDLVAAMAELSHDAVVVTRGDHHERYDVPVDAILTMQTDANAFYSDVLSRMRRDASDIFRTYQQLEISYGRVLGTERLLDRLPGMDQRYRRVKAIMMSLETDMSRWIQVRTETSVVVPRADRVASMVESEARWADADEDRRRAGRRRASVKLYSDVAAAARELETEVSRPRPSEEAVRNLMADLESLHRRASTMMRKAGFSETVNRQDGQLGIDIHRLKQAVEAIVGPIPSRPAPRPIDRVRVHPRAPR